MADAIENRLRDIISTADHEALLRVRQELERGAEVPLVTGEEQAFRILRAAPDQRYTLGVAWHADRADTSPAASGHRDTVPAVVIERTAWDWMARSREVGILHLDGTEGHGTVVESYIYRGPEWTITAIDGAEQIIRAGDWMVGVIWDEATWPAVKRQQLDGYSPQGRAVRRPAPTGGVLNHA